LGTNLLINIPNIVLVRKLVAFAHGELEVPGLKNATLIGRKTRLLRTACKDATLSTQRKSAEE